MASSTYLVWVERDGMLRSLLFDCVTSVTVQLETEVTEHPVEDGPDVTDHMREKLDSVEIEAFVSNAPLDDSATRTNFGFSGKVVPVELKVEKYKAPLEATPGSVFSAASDAVGAVADLIAGNGEAKYSAQVFKFEEKRNIVAETLQRLMVARKNGGLFQVATREELFKDMVLKSCSFKRDPGMGDAATFVLSFQHIRKVRVALVAAPDPTEPRAKSAQKKGAKDPVETTPSEKTKSMLKGLADAAFGSRP